jgi:hypothetical protein
MLKKQCSVGITLVAILTAPTGLSARLNDPSTNAVSLARKALDAMGGEQKLRNMETIIFKAIGHRNMLEQSERPEGPYVVEYEEISEARDFKTNSLRRSIRGKVLTQPKFETVTTVSGEASTISYGGQPGPGTPGEVFEADEELALGPERILLTALSASNLRAEDDTVLQSVPHHVIAFSWRTSPVRVFLNAETGLPTAVEWVSANPYSSFWRTWGDVTTRVYYSFWWLAAEGIHYPLQWDIVKNGMADHTWAIDTIEINASLPADTFLISDTDRIAYKKNSVVTGQVLRSNLDQRPLAQGTEFYPGIVQFPGAMNTALVLQPDGIVVLEAPISAAYSQRVLKEAERRFPGAPVKAVISTSDSWPHFSGLREYVARGIPVYILDLNRPILERFLASPRTFFPDNFAKTPRKPDFRIVSAKTVIGEGPNRLEIYPLRGETSERQLMVYFPGHQLLYGSDPFQKLDDRSYFNAQTVSEVVHAVEREHLSVEKFFMMHMGITPWGELPRVIEKTESSAKSKPQ